MQPPWFDFSLILLLLLLCCVVFFVILFCEPKTVRRGVFASTSNTHTHTQTNKLRNKSHETKKKSKSEERIVSDTGWFTNGSGISLSSVDNFTTLQLLCMSLFFFTVSSSLFRISDTQWYPTYWHPAALLWSPGLNQSRDRIELIGKPFLT